jgi:hypothetical protein
MTKSPKKTKTKPKNNRKYPDSLPQTKNHTMEKRGRGKNLPSSPPTHGGVYTTRNAQSINLARSSQSLSDLRWSDNNHYSIFPACYTNTATSSLLHASTNAPIPKPYHWPQYLPIPGQLQPLPKSILREPGKSKPFHYTNKREHTESLCQPKCTSKQYTKDASFWHVTDTPKTLSAAHALTLTKPTKTSSRRLSQMGEKMLL